MRPSDLPPGVLPSDIPGNRPEDRAWEEWEQHALSVALAVLWLIEKHARHYPTNDLEAAIRYFEGD